jgi:acyl-CoA synthetase (AMP-forming)/AMP-acid ligase II
MFVEGATQVPGIAEMPRSGTGKILHRLLREKYGMWKDHR